MKNYNKKKGFTIVELVITIAVIGILTAVLVPTFVNLVNKANEASNQSFVKNLNTQMAMRESEEGKNKTMHEAILDAREIGFDVEKLTPVNGRDLVWDSVSNRFLLLEPNGDVWYGKDEKKATRDIDVWKVYDSMPGTQKFSIYAKTGWSAEEVENLTVGFDTGSNILIQSVSYVNPSLENAKDGVVIRTGSQFTDLNVNAPYDEVTHYGAGKDLDITAIKPGTFHESGSWRQITLTSGALELAEGSFVGEVVKNGGTLVNEGVIASPITGTDAASGITNTGTIGIDEDSVLKIGKADTLANLAFAQSTGVFDHEGLNIELTADIDLKGKTWVPFGAEIEDAAEIYKFHGTIDGKGHALSNLSNGGYKGKITPNHSTSTVGDLYGFIATVTDDVTIQNIEFNNVNIDSESTKTCGVVIADTHGATTVSLRKVDVNGTVIGLDKVGGLIGYAQNAHVRIQNCNVDAKLVATKTSGNNRVGGLIGYIGNFGIVSVYDSDVNGTITGQITNMFGALTGGLTSNEKVEGVGLKAEGFTTTASVKDPTPGKVSATADGKVIIGVNSCGFATGDELEVDLEAGFTFQQGNPTFLAKLA